MKPTSKRKLTPQKAAKGLHEVTVPPPGNSGDVLSSGLSGASTGATLGSAIPGVGTAVGAVAGGVVGVGGGIIQAQHADYLNQQATQHNQYVKANDLVSGADITQGQRGQYAQGTEATQATKPIEVEKDELVFRKAGDQFRLKADFQGGKSHAQGGEAYTAQEGDVIFPGKQRKQALAHLQAGNHTALEGMRMRLPKDTNPQGQAESGADLLNPDAPTQYLPSRYASGQWNANPANRYGAYGVPGAAQAGLATGQSTYLAKDPMGNFDGPVNAYQDPRNAPGQKSYYQSSLPTAIQGGVANNNGLDAQAGTIPASLSTIPTGTVNPTQTSSGTIIGQEKGQGAGVGNYLKYASAANNLIQGFSTPEKVQENYVEPTLQQYQDRSDPQRRQSNMVTNAQTSNARNTSGGQVSNLRSNQQIAQAEGYSRKQEIDNREQGLADNIRASNTQEVGRTKGINLELKNQYAAQNATARANAMAYKDAAFGQVASLGNAQEQDGYLRQRDAKMDDYNKSYLGYLNQTTKYTTDGKGSPLEFNPKGSSSLPPQRGYRAGSGDYETETYDQATGNRKTTRRRKLGSSPLTSND